jgi:hypothetical protein
MVFPVRPVWPEEMILRAASGGIFPELTILFETIDWSRIGITVVEALDLCCCIKRWRREFCLLAHGKCRIPTYSAVDHCLPENLSVNLPGS